MPSVAEEREPDVPVFYEKLAAAKEGKREPKNVRKYRGLGMAAAAAGGGLLAGYGADALNRGATRSARRADEAKHLRKLHAKIDPEVAQVVSEESIAKLMRNTPPQYRPETFAILDDFLQDGDAFLPNVGVDAGGRLGFSARSGKGSINTRGIISSSLKTGDTTGLMHELGHATGKLGYGKNKLYSGLYGGSVRLTRGRPGALFGIGRAGAESYNVGNAQSQRDLDKIEKRTNLLTGLHGLATAPMLFEEGRANIRAIGLGKKFGAKVSKRQLASAMGTYLANAAGQTLLPHYLIKKRIKQRRKALAGKGR